MSLVLPIARQRFKGSPSFPSGRCVSGIDLFDLINRGPSVLSEVKNVHFPVAVDHPHTNRHVTQGAKSFGHESSRVIVDATLPEKLSDGMLEDRR